MKNIVKFSLLGSLFISNAYSMKRSYGEMIDNLPLKMEQKKSNAASEIMTQTTSFNSLPLELKLKILDPYFDNLQNRSLPYFFNLEENNTTTPKLQDCLNRIKILKTLNKSYYKFVMESPAFCEHLIDKMAYALRKDEQEIVKHLLLPSVEKCSDWLKRRKIRNEFNTALTNHDLNAAKQLLHKININQKDFTGQTPLLSVIKRFIYTNNPTSDIRNKYYQLMEELLQGKANPNIFDKDRNFSPLTLAAEDLSPSNFVELLLKYGANPNAQNKDGDTPLIIATGAMENHTPVILDNLIAAGADINLQNNKGKTALMCMAKMSDHYLDIYLDIAELLINKGAVPDLKDNNGKTALDIAGEHDNEPLIEYLKSLQKQSDN